MDTAIDARLTFLCAVAVHAEIEELLPQFRRRHGIEVDVNYDVNPAVAKRVMAGEGFDVGLNNPWYVEEMIKFGLVIPDIHVPFGRVPLTIGAAGPEPKQIASSHEAVRNLLLDADSIAYMSTGTSGKTFLRAIEIMGLQDHLRDRLRPMGPASRRSPLRRVKCNTPSPRFRGSSPLPPSRRSRPSLRNLVWISTCPCSFIGAVALDQACSSSNSCRIPA